MEAQVLQSVEHIWEDHRTALGDALTEVADGLQDLLRLDQYHRHGHDFDELKRTLGPLAADQLDIETLARTLESGTATRAMPAERLARVEALLPALRQMKDDWSTATLEDSQASLDDGEDEILRAAEAHLDRLSAVFRSMRMAQLEIRSKYSPEVHDAVFSNLDWRQLGSGELRLSPPFVVTADFNTNSRARLRTMLALLETGMPIKFLVLRSEAGGQDAAAPGRRLPPALKLETLPLAMGGVYFLQTHFATPEFQDRIGAALGAARPAVISVLCPRADEEGSAFETRAERAVRARAVPMCVYDPDLDKRLGPCLDLSSNPEVEAIWVTDKLVARNAGGERVESDEPFTFAHFCASEPGFDADLSKPPEVADALVPLTEYMALSEQQRLGKLPFIRLLAGDDTIVRRIVSQNLVLQCSERLNVWQTLQEISGIDNPYVNRARAALQLDLGAQQAALRREMEQAAADREQAAVASTVRKLVARLTGVDPAGS